MEFLVPLYPLLGILLYPPEASGGYFGLVFATLPPPRVEIFGDNSLR